MNELFELFITFAKIGVTTFGGGIAMLPILQHEITEKRHWATDEELIDYFAIGQCTPGIIAVNTATFIGHKRKGKLGGIAATLGMVFPSLVIIMILAGLIRNYAELTAVKNAFAGIQVAVCVLISGSTVKLIRKGVIDKATAVIFILIFLLSSLINLSPIFYVIAAGAAGIFLKEKEVNGKK